MTVLSTFFFIAGLMALPFSSESANPLPAPDKHAVAAQYETEKEAKEALTLPHLTELAEQGNADAQVKLASMYYKGEGTEKDVKKAFSWIKKAAQQGNADTQALLSHMYYNGEGTEKDVKKAFSWIEKAAVQGLAYAQNALAFMYYSILG